MLANSSLACIVKRGNIRYNKKHTMRGEINELPSPVSGMATPDFR